MNCSEDFIAGRVRFLGEQDGPPERELKGALAQVLGCGQSTLRAYLARVTYGGPSPVSVALCLFAPPGADSDTVEKVTRVFAHRFAAREHLDVIFISDSQESELAKCCKPFFNRQV